MKQPYIAPDATRRRVFLENGIAASASVPLSDTSVVQQTDWADVTDVPAGAGADKRGDLFWTY
jgi:hypothetical protein